MNESHQRQRPLPCGLFVMLLGDSSSSLRYIIHVYIYYVMYINVYIYIMINIIIIHASCLSFLSCVCPQPVLASDKKLLS